MSSHVRTRFAPSPTGYMHIGGMRTALFCWLFARHHGGTFILRIDDTDQQRNNDEALGPILRAFRWLNLEWDEGPVYENGHVDMTRVKGDKGPYFQSQRKDLYDRELHRLLETRKAYRDFDPPEKFAEGRTLAEKEKRVFLNERTWLEASDADIQKQLDAGTPYVVRFAIPREHTVVINDHVRGEVKFDAGLMADPVIVRTGGMPLYNFATVVDDGLMEITHVVRAEEHLSNTPLQAMLHEALGYKMPEFAHIPFVAAPGSKEKLSKRKLDQYKKNSAFAKLFNIGSDVFPKLGLEQSAGLDPVMVEFYEKAGFLPAGVLNALVRLGWSFDDKTEYFSLEDMIREFSLERVIKSAAGLDPEKLLSYEAYWMGQLTLEDKLNGCLPFLVKAGYIKADYDDVTRLEVAKIIEAIGDRLTVFSDVLRFDEFFVADNEMTWDEKGFEKRITKAEGAADLLFDLSGVILNSDIAGASDFDRVVHQFVEQRGLQIGQIIHALRLSVTGKTSGVGMFEAMELLGKERCVRRMERTVEKAKG
ncbi:glutamate--tRNA ligase [Lacunimicrobium album]